MESASHEDAIGRKALLDWIDWVLIAAIVVDSAILVGSVGQPLFAMWKQRGRPGMQVSRETGVERSILMRYLLYLPEDFTRDTKWPLVIYLHGSGARGDDIEKVRRGRLPAMVDKGKMFPFVLVSPQCPNGTSWEPCRVLALIEHVSTDWPIDRRRVYLVGYSMGGYGTWQTATAAPERFAAIAPIAGGGDPDWASSLTNLPIWAFHGTADKIVPFEAGRKMVKAVRAAGGEVKFTAYEGEWHGIARKVFADDELWTWMLKQKRSSVRKDTKTTKSFPRHAGTGT